MYYLIDRKVLLVRTYKRAQFSDISKIKGLVSAITCPASVVAKRRSSVPTFQGRFVSDNPKIGVIDM